MKQEPEYQTTRIWKRTHKQLRILAATTGETQVELLDRLVIEETKRVQEKQGKKK